MTPPVNPNDSGATTPTESQPSTTSDPAMGKNNGTMGPTTGTTGATTVPPRR